MLFQYMLGLNTDRSPIGKAKIWMCQKNVCQYWVRSVSMTLGHTSAALHIRLRFGYTIDLIDFFLYLVEL